MSNWKLYTPEGTGDLLPKQCAEKTATENTIAEVFSGYGYQVTETPVMQFYDAYDTPTGKMEQEMLYKFFDKEGRILVLRPDVTTSLTRMAATKLAEAPMPIRLQYSGKVFRYVDSYSSVQREFCQSGIELFGVKNDLADSEVILCAIEALLACGLENFQIEIGQVEFFKGLVEQAKLSEEDAEQIRRHIDKKDMLALRETLKKLNVPQEVGDILQKLPTLFGEIELLDDIASEGLNEKSAAALDNLRSVYQILSDCGFEKYISLDLSLVKGINSYTGIIFKGITHGIGFPICSGGRYDSLPNEFGATFPAVGMAIGTDRLLSVLTRQNLLDVPIGSDLLVFGDSPALCFRVLSELREAGYTAEQYLTDNSYESALAYAERANIQGVCRLCSDGTLSIYNREEKTESKLTLEELLGEHEEDCCCGHHHD